MEPITIFSSTSDFLDRKGSKDQKRHQEKVLEALNTNLADLITDEGVLSIEGEKTVKIPLRGMIEYRFRFGNDDDKIGHGSGREGRGSSLPKDGSSSGSKASNQSVDPVYEAEVDMDLLTEVLFDRLGLPHLRPNRGGEVEQEEIEFRDLRTVGSPPLLDRRRSLKNAILRQKKDQLQGEMIRLSRPDLRYRTWSEIRSHKTKAHIIAIRDISGSMGQFERFMSRSMFFWMTRFLRKKYQAIRFTFIVHDAKAKVVSENDFFHLGGGGGTMISSAYRLANEILDGRLDPENENTYLFHFSDGDNLAQDQEACLGELDGILKKINLMCYGEIRRSWRATEKGSLYSLLQEKEGQRLRIEQMQERQDILKVLQKFLQSEEVPV